MARDSYRPVAIYTYCCMSCERKRDIAPPNVKQSLKDQHFSELRYAEKDLLLITISRRPCRLSKWLREPRQSSIPAPSTHSEGAQAQRGPVVCPRPQRRQVRSWEQDAGPPDPDWGCALLHHSAATAASQASQKTWSLYWHPKQGKLPLTIFLGSPSPPKKYNQIQISFQGLSSAWKAQPQLQQTHARQGKGQPKVTQPRRGWKTQG